MHARTHAHTHPLVGLLFAYLVNLVQELPYPQLELSQLLLLHHSAIVHCVFPHIQLKVDTLCTAKWERKRRQERKEEEEREGREGGRGQQAMEGKG